MGSKYLIEKTSALNFFTTILSISDFLQRPEDLVVLDPFVIFSAITSLLAKLEYGQSKQTNNRYR